MRYIALACDYDGTLAHDGRVNQATRAALERLKASGRRLVLVTGRRVEDLQRVFPDFGVFERIVAENGAVLVDPAAREQRTLAEPPSMAFIDRLRDRGVSPFDVGHVIVATWRPNEVEVLSAIRDLGLEHQVIFNKDAVMVLPPGVNKATGLAAALDELRLSPHNVVAVGDAENDHALLQACECGVAVANAVPMLKERADLVTEAPRGEGVTQLIDRLIATDLADVSLALARHDVLLGRDSGGADVRLSPYGHNVLLAGPSGVGKSTLTNGLLERLADRGYQFCLVDPEGDHEAFRPAVVLGTAQKAPEPAEVMAVLEVPSQNAIVNLTGVTLEERPRLFDQLAGPAPGTARAGRASPLARAGRSASPAAGDLAAGIRLHTEPPAQPAHGDDRSRPGGAGGPAGSGHAAAARGRTPRPWSIGSRKRSERARPVRAPSGAHPGRGVAVEARQRRRWTASPWSRRGPRTGATGASTPRAS